MQDEYNLVGLLVRRAAAAGVGEAFDSAAASDPPRSHIHHPSILDRRDEFRAKVRKKERKQKRVKVQIYLE